MTEILLGAILLFLILDRCGLTFSFKDKEEDYIRFFPPTPISEGRFEIPPTEKGEKFMRNVSRMHPFHGLDPHHHHPQPPKDEEKKDEGNIPGGTYV